MVMDPSPLFIRYCGGDDHHEPISDHARSLLDGQIFLSRQLADAGHYPAIDIEQSISRVMPAVVCADQLSLLNKFKKYYSAYARNQDIINIGMYQHGTDKTTDESIRYKERFEHFLCQGMNEPCDMHTSIKQLIDIFLADK